MLMPDVHVYSRSFARQSVACSSRGIGALRLGWVLLMIGGFCCCALSLVAQTSDSRTAEESTKSSRATTDLKSDDLLPERIPVRIIESHSENGNRTLDKRSVEICGTDGHFEPYQDIERETVTVDASTVKTTTRTFARDVNGSKALV